MARTKCFTPVAIAALVLTVCGGNALANDANTVNKAENTAPGAPTKVALVTLEKSAYAAWKSKDARFWDTFLSDKFVGWGSSGRLDKASATKEYTGADCAIKSYALSDEQMRPLGKGAELITYKITVDGTCGGQSSRLAVGRQAYTFAMLISGKEPFTPKRQLSIQKRRSQAS